MEDMKDKEEEEEEEMWNSSRLGNLMSQELQRGTL